MSGRYQQSGDLQNSNPPQEEGSQPSNPDLINQGNNGNINLAEIINSQDLGPLTLSASTGLLHLAYHAQDGDGNYLYNDDNDPLYSQFILPFYTSEHWFDDRQQALNIGINDQVPWRLPINLPDDYSYDPSNPSPVQYGEFILSVAQINNDPELLRGLVYSHYPAMVEVWDRIQQMPEDRVINLSPHYDQINHYSQKDFSSSGALGAVIDSRMRDGSARIKNHITQVLPIDISNHLSPRTLETILLDYPFSALMANENFIGAYGIDFPEGGNYFFEPYFYPTSPNLELFPINPHPSNINDYWTGQSLAEDFISGSFLDITGAVRIRQYSIFNVARIADNLSDGSIMIYNYPEFNRHYGDKAYYINAAQAYEAYDRADLALSDINENVNGAYPIIATPSNLYSPASVGYNQAFLSDRNLNVSAYTESIESPVFSAAFCGQNGLFIGGPIPVGTNKVFGEDMNLYANYHDPYVTASFFNAAFQASKSKFPAFSGTNTTLLNMLFQTSGVDANLGAPLFDYESFVTILEEQNSVLAGLGEQVFNRFTAISYPREVTEGVELDGNRPVKPSDTEFTSDNLAYQTNIFNTASVSPQLYYQNGELDTANGNGESIAGSEFLYIPNKETPDEDISSVITHAVIGFEAELALEPAFNINQYVNGMKLFIDIDDPDRGQVVTMPLYPFGCGFDSISYIDTGEVRADGKKVYNISAFVPHHHLNFVYGGREVWVSDGTDLKVHFHNHMMPLSENNFDLKNLFVQFDAWQPNSEGSREFLEEITGDITIPTIAFQELPSYETFNPVIISGQSPVETASYQCTYGDETVPCYKADIDEGVSANELLDICPNSDIIYEQDGEYFCPVVPSSTAVQTNTNGIIVTP